MRSFRIILGAAVYLLVFLSFSSFADVKRYSVPIGNSPVIGPPHAPVTIVEFLDYQ
jgi:hypothetical protein